MTINFDKGQVTPGNLTAFGITITSRHGMAQELVEMLAFAQRAAASDAAEQVKSLFYDSNSCVCNIQLAGQMSQSDPAAQPVLDVALATLGQFEWQDVIHHGTGAR